MSQQQWRGQPPGPGYPQQGSAPWGQSGFGQSGFGQGGFGQSGFGQPGLNQPSYGQAPYGQAPYGRPPQGSGYGGGVPPYGQPPSAPRARNPLKLVLLGLIALTVVGLAGLVTVNLIGGGSEVAYQNDDYKVPPPDKNPPQIPVPETYGEAEQWLTKSPFYGQSVPIPVRCTSQPINVASADDAQLKSHFEGLMECLVRVWQPPITGAGFQIVRPTVTIYGKEINTKCGRSGVNAFYCSADQQVYFSNLLPNAVPIVKQDKWAADVVMAHEFGHAIQGRTGLLISAHALAQRAGSEAEQNQEIRRLEQQADCFSGMFIRSVSRSLGVQQSDLDGIQKTYVAVGDDTLSGDPDINGNHGLARSRLYWGNIGLGNSPVSACNTFTAPASKVR